VANSLQDQVNRATQAAQGNVAASLAQNNNAVSSQLANVYQNQGNAAGSLTAQGANANMQGANTIANYIAAPNQQAPSVSEYAPLIQQAAQASQQHPTTTMTVNPNAYNNPATNPILQNSPAPNQNPYSQSIASSVGGGALGQGGYSNPNGATFFGPGYGAAPNQQQGGSDPFLSFLGLG
jgi:predicted glycosyltransferase